MQYGIINYTCCLEGFFFQMKGLKHKKILILFKMAANVHALKELMLFSKK